MLPVVGALPGPGSVYLDPQIRPVVVSPHTVYFFIKPVASQRQKQKLHSLWISEQAAVGAAERQLLVRNMQKDLELAEEQAAR